MYLNYNRSTYSCYGENESHSDPKFWANFISYLHVIYLYYKAKYEDLITIINFYVKNRLVLVCIHIKRADPSRYMMSL